MRLSALFLILAALIAYDAVRYDGANTKAVWSTIEHEFDRLRSTAGAPDGPVTTSDRQG